MPVEFRQLFNGMSVLLGLDMGRTMYRVGDMDREGPEMLVRHLALHANDASPEFSYDPWTCLSPLRTSTQRYRVLTSEL